MVPVHNEKRPSYKKTKLGWIPEEWEVLKIGDITRIYSGGTPSRKNPTLYNGNISWIKSGELNQGKVFMTEENISEKGLRMSSAKIVKSETILLALYGATAGVVGITKIEAAINQAILAIQPNGDKIHNDFLFFSLKYIMPTLVKRLVQGGQPNLNASLVKNIKLSCPMCIFEQKKIAQILSTWDLAIEKYELLIKKYELRKKGLMQQLLSGKKRFFAFVSACTNAPLDKRKFERTNWINIKLIERIDRFIVPMRDKPKKFSGNIPWCRIEDFSGKYLFDSKSGQYVDEDTIKEMNLKVYPNGTVLVSCSANLGECAIVAKPLVTNQTFIGLVPGKNIDNEFLYYLMIFSARNLNRLSSGTTISYLSRNEFERFKVKIPPILEEQQRISRILDTCDNELQILQTQLFALKKQKKGLMQVLLTGRKRVKTQ